MPPPSPPFAPPDGWFYFDDVDAHAGDDGASDGDARPQHGPFTLIELEEWCHDGYFAHDMLIRQGRRGVDVVISAAFAASGLSLRRSEPAGAGADGADSGDESQSGWYYSDDDDPLVQHGPFDLNELRSWFDGGHFEPDMRVRHGRAGEGVTICDAIGAEAGKVHVL